jgi:hypothetical protein
MLVAWGVPVDYPTLTISGAVRIGAGVGWLSIDQGGLQSPGIPGIEAYRPLD